MLRKIIVIPVVAAVSILAFIFCSGAGLKFKDEARFDRILHAVAEVLNNGHYSPKAINDLFSEQVFNEYIDRLDPERIIFLNSDVEKLSEYRYTIDDELLGRPVKFFYSINSLYKERLSRLNAGYDDLLKQPFDFSVPDSMEGDFNKRKRPADAAAQSKLLMGKLKYMALEKFVDLQEMREHAKEQKDKAKTDLQLEEEARSFTASAFRKTMERQLTKTTDDDRFSVFINAITNLMDPHTDFFMPVEKRSWDEDLTGKFYGIGAVITEEDGYPRVYSVSPGGPAWKTGEVNDGDIILKIAQANQEPVEVAGYDVNEAVKLIRGDKGTKVILTLKKADGSTKAVTIIREELKLEEVFAKSSVIQQNGRKTGYIYLPKFYSAMGEVGGRNCSEDIAAEVIKLKQQQVESIIIDIRDNGGGSLYEVIRMVGLFIPDGPVVQVKDSEGRISSHGDSDKKVLYNGPLVVMVNEFSASASEIFAAAIQDYKRGIVVGSSSTYGKGTVQRPIPLSELKGEEKDNLGTVHLTIQKYYRINGASTQLKGVQPDIVLPGYYEYFKFKEKDDPSALAWDELKMLSYKTWEQQPYLDSVQENFFRRTDTNVTFTLIQQNVKWLADQSEGVRYLSLKAYKEKTERIRQKVNETRKLMRLNSSMDIHLLDLTGPADKSSGERNERWLNFLKDDIYLAEAVNISDDLVSSRSNRYAAR